MITTMQAERQVDHDDLADVVELRAGGRPILARRPRA